MTKKKKLRNEQRRSKGSTSTEKQDDNTDHPSPRTPQKPETPRDGPPKQETPPNNSSPQQPGVTLEAHVQSQNNPVPIVLHFLWMAFMAGALFTTPVTYRVFTTTVWSLQTAFYTAAFVGHFWRRLESTLNFWCLHLIHGTTWLTVLSVGFWRDPDYGARARVVGVNENAIRLRVYLPATAILVYTWSKRDVICVDFYERLARLSPSERRCNVLYQMWSPVLPLCTWYTCCRPSNGYLTDLPNWPSLKLISSACILCNGALQLLLFLKYNRYRGHVIWLPFNRGFFVLVATGGWARTFSKSFSDSASDTPFAGHDPFASASAGGGIPFAGSPFGPDNSFAGGPFGNAGSGGPFADGPFGSAGASGPFAGGPFGSAGAGGPFGSNPFGSAGASGPFAGGPFAGN